MGRLSRQDGVGFLVAFAIVTAPLAAMMGAWDTMSFSKDPPIGPRVYLLPVAVGLAAALLAVAAAVAVDRRPELRLESHAGFGSLALLLVLASFCVWGNWFFRFAERFGG